MADSDELDEGWGDDPVEKVPAKPASSPRAAAPASAPRSRDARATLPPPMPEQEYIEKILATEEEQAASKPPRQRLNTLIERDPATGVITAKSSGWGVALSSELKGVGAMLKAQLAPTGGGSQKR